MPTVYLPLASAEAHGSIGEIIVYQGVTVRKYVVPVDPRTTAQIDQRHLFYDIQKMLCSQGIYARAARRTQFGSRWASAIFQYLTANARENWDLLAAVFSGFASSFQEEWDSYAPYQATFNRPGLVFFVCARACDTWASAQNKELYGSPEAEIDTAPNMATWWTKDLSGIPGAGKYDESASFLSYWGVWNTAIDVSAYGGTYRYSGFPGSMTCSFVFYGTKLSVIFTKRSDAGNMIVSIDGVQVAAVSQYSSSNQYQQTWTSEQLIKGLHMVWLGNDSVQSLTIDGVELFGNVPRTSVPKVIGGVYAIGVLEMARQNSQPSTPETGIQKVYWLSDGKLYSMGSDGVSVEIGAGGLTQEEADLLYAAIGHTHADPDKWSEAVKDSNQDVTFSNVMTDCTGLSFANEIGVYRYELFLLYSGNNGIRDFAARVTASAGSLYGWWQAIGDNGTSDAIYNPGPQRVAGAAYFGDVLLGVDGSDTVRLALINGMFRTTSAGIIKVQFAQASAGVSTHARVCAGTVLRWRRLG